MTEAELQPLVTRCPDCATQFKVSEAQLQVANGKVRCGSCLAVFEGVDNLVWDSEFDADESADVTLDDLLDQLEDKAATAKPEPESEIEVTASTSAKLDTVADLEVQSAPQLESELEPELGPELQIEQEPAPEARDQELRAQTDSATATDVDAELDQELDQELVAEKIIQAANASTEPSVDFAVELIEVPAEDTLLDLGSNYVGPDYASLNRTPDQHEEQQRRSRNRREAMAEMRALAAQREADDAAAPIDETRIADTPASVPAVTEADLTTASTGASSTGAYGRSEQLEQVWERKPQAASETQSETQPEEVTGELATTGVAARVRNWRIPLVVGALVLLVAQVMYLQFDDWAVDPTFRPAYAAACGVLPCDLPDRRDLGLLKSRALKVRSHPQKEGALLVDALIVNEADFDQPFPELHLKFSSVEGNRLASERFSPEDYLAGDMAGAKMMPARTPVHIEVQAIDPGPNAVSYTLDFE